MSDPQLPSSLPTSQSLVALDQTPLRRSLTRLDSAARARFMAVGADVEAIVVDLTDRLEARAHVAVGDALRTHALSLLGAAIGLGVVAGYLTGPRSRSVFRS